MIGHRYRLRCASVPCAAMVGPASRTPRPPGGPSAPAATISAVTPFASSRASPRPCHSVGHVGTDQPASANRSHHSPTVRSGSQLSANHARTSARTPPASSPLAEDAGCESTTCWLIGAPLHLIGDAGPDAPSRGPMSPLHLIGDAGPDAPSRGPMSPLHLIARNETDRTHDSLALRARSLVPLPIELRFVRSNLPPITEASLSTAR